MFWNRDCKDYILRLTVRGSRLRIVTTPQTCAEGGKGRKRLDSIETADEESVEFRSRWAVMTPDCRARRAQGRVGPTDIDRSFD